MSYGYCTKVNSTTTVGQLSITNDQQPPGIHASCHAVWLHNSGNVTIYYTYNTDVDPTMDNSFELSPGMMILLTGSDSEQIKKIKHRTESAPGEFKWAKMK